MRLASWLHGRFHRIIYGLRIGILRISITITPLTEPEQRVSITQGGDEVNILLDHPFERTLHQDHKPVVRVNKRRFSTSSVRSMSDIILEPSRTLKSRVRRSSVVSTS